MPHSNEKTRFKEPNEPGALFGNLARVVIAISIALLAGLLIALSAFRSNGEKPLNSLVSPGVAPKPEVNPFRP